MRSLLLLLKPMQIFHKLEDVPAGFGPTVVSVGNFDGVHRAHQLVLRNLVERETAECEIGCYYVRAASHADPAS